MPIQLGELKLYSLKELSKKFGYHNVYLKNIYSARKTQSKKNGD